MPGPYSSGERRCVERWKPGTVDPPDAGGSGRQLRWYDTITARMPTAEESQRLRMAPGTPLLVHTRIGFDAEDRPVRYLVTRMAADRVEVSYGLEA